MSHGSSTGQPLAMQKAPDPWSFFWIASPCCTGCDDAKEMQIFGDMAPASHLTVNDVVMMESDPGYKAPSASERFSSLHTNFANMNLALNLGRKDTPAMPDNVSGSVDRASARLDDPEVPATDTSASQQRRLSAATDSSETEVLSAEEVAKRRAEKAKEMEHRDLANLITSFIDHALRGHRCVHLHSHSHERSVSRYSIDSDLEHLSIDADVYSAGHEPIVCSLASIHDVVIDGEQASFPFPQGMPERLLKGELARLVMIVYTTGLDLFGVCLLLETRKARDEFVDSLRILCMYAESARDIRLLLHRHGYVHRHSTIQSTRSMLEAATVGQHRANKDLFQERRTLHKPYIAATAPGDDIEVAVDGSELAARASERAARLKASRTSERPTGDAGTEGVASLGAAKAAEMTEHPQVAEHLVTAGAAQEHCGGKLEQGCMVVVLSALLDECMADIDGKLARCEAFDQETGLWTVQLDDGTRQTVAPSKLSLAYRNSRESVPAAAATESHGDKTAAGVEGRIDSEAGEYSEASLVGSWMYADGEAQYDVIATTFGYYIFRQQTPAGRIEGHLTQEGDWFQGALLMGEAERKWGHIRVCLKDGKAISNFRATEDEPWGDEVAASRTKAAEVVEARESSGKTHETVGHDAEGAECAQGAEPWRSDPKSLEVDEPALDGSEVAESDTISSASCALDAVTGMETQSAAVREASMDSVSSMVNGIEVPKLDLSNLRASRRKPADNGVKNEIKSEIKNEAT